MVTIKPGDFKKILRRAEQLIAKEKVNPTIMIITIVTLLIILLLNSYYNRKREWIVIKPKIKKVEEKNKEIEEKGIFSEEAIKKEGREDEKPKRRKAKRLSKEELRKYFPGVFGKEGDR